MQLGMKHCGRFTDRRVGGPRAAGGGGERSCTPGTTPSALPTLPRCRDSPQLPLGHGQDRAQKPVGRQRKRCRPKHLAGDGFEGQGRGAPASPALLPASEGRAWVPTRAPALRGRITRVPPDAGEPRAALRPGGSSRPFPGGGGVSWRETKTTSFLRLAKRPPKRQQPPSTRGRAPPAAHASLPRPASHRERTRGQQQPAVMNPT